MIIKKNTKLRLKCFYMFKNNIRYLLVKIIAILLEMIDHDIVSRFTQSLNEPFIKGWKCVIVSSSLSKVI